MADSKRYFSWAAIQKSIAAAAVTIHSDFQPTLLVAISGGGLIPARLLRSFLKAKTLKNLPLQTIGLTLYDDNDQQMDHVKRTQWLSPDFDISGQRIIMVDEVDDSRKTIAYAVEEMLKYFDEVEAAHRQRGSSWVRPTLGVYVVHNKLREKVAEISQEVYPRNYFAQDMPNMWHVYPWDALDIDLHTALAVAQSRSAEPAAADEPPSMASTSMASAAIPMPRSGSRQGSAAGSPSPAYRGSATLVSSLPESSSWHRLEVAAGSRH